MNNWVQQLFSSTDKLFDILNVGRLIFYTAAGILVVYPIAMTLNLLTLATKSANFYSSFAEIQKLQPAWPILLFASLVMGFIIANVGFTTVIIPLSQKLIKTELKNFKPSIYDFPYRYPLLKNSKSEDYQAWLTSEYFRYVEISLYIPMGFVFGLFLLAGYALSYVFFKDLNQLSMSEIYDVLIFLAVLTTFISVLLVYVWPEFWLPRVVKPTLSTSIKAQISLGLAVEEYLKNSNKNME